MHVFIQLATLILRRFSNLTLQFFDSFLPCNTTFSVSAQRLMNGFYQTIWHKTEQNICFKLISYMCKLVVWSGFYEALRVPTPHLRNAHFFITRLYKIGQKPKFRQCYFLGNIKNIKIYILGHILVPVSEDSYDTAGYRPVPARLSHMA